MKLVDLPVVVKNLVDALLLLPEHHLSETCPLVLAKKLCAKYVDELEFLTTQALETKSSALIAIDVAKAAPVISNLRIYLHSVYDDGRACPFEEVRWFLNKLFRQDTSRHPWYSIPTIVRDAVTIGFVELDGIDFSALCVAETARRTLDNESEISQ